MIPRKQIINKRKIRRQKKEKKIQMGGMSKTKIVIKIRKFIITICKKIIKSWDFFII